MTTYHSSQELSWQTRLLVAWKTHCENTDSKVTSLTATASDRRLSTATNVGIVKQKAWCAQNPRIKPEALNALKWWCLKSAEIWHFARSYPFDIYWGNLWEQTFCCPVIDGSGSPAVLWSHSHRQFLDGHSSNSLYWMTNPCTGHMALAYSNWTDTCTRSVTTK